MKTAKMNVWETEDEYASTAAQASLPTPTDTPHRTPSRNSRRSNRRKSTSPVPSSSPPPLPNGDTNSRRNSKDVTNDDSISILDPRRFTPTLHANLVAEILALRRDQEEKIKFIEGLESNLHASRGEYESLGATLSATAKETRSLKRQLALLEGGTSSALGELARERDEAVDSLADFKKRLEGAQKKARSQEEDSDRVHELWARDKDTWEDDKRKYERKIHVVEGRLKAVLEEVAAYQTASQVHQHEGESEADEAPKENGVGHGSDTASIRSMSMTNSIRFSMMTSKMNGVSLADELDLEEEDSHTDHDGRESAMSFVNHQRNQSRESVRSRAHLRNQSIDSLRRPGSVAHGRLMANQVLDKLHGGIVETDEEAEREMVDGKDHGTTSDGPSVMDRSAYVDTGVQYSPPPSPELKATLVSLPAVALALAENERLLEGPAKPVPIVEAPKQHHTGPEWEIEANQRRKRVRASPPLIIEPVVNGPMISAGSQTLDDPPSPPKTPKSPTIAPSLLPAHRVPVEMKSSITQTDFPELITPMAFLSHPPIPIPSISIHPPTSRPATPREPRLPQYFKDAGCQVSMQASISTRSASVQTEEIRVDKRIALLPKHLQPSSISSKPPSPEPLTAFERGRYSPSPVALPPRNPRRMNSQQSVKSTKSLKEIPSSPPRPQSLESQEAPINDDGPLVNNRGSGSTNSISVRRPRRSSSLFAGFDGISSDDGDDFGDADMSDNDFRTALSAPKPKSSGRALGKRSSVAPKSVPEDVEPTEERPRYPRSNLKQPGGYESNGFFSLPDAPSLPGQKGSTRPPVRQLDKPLTLAGSMKQGVMRRTALISNGIAAHQGRSRSPSFPEPIREPPFPIPTRASSRKPPFSVSAPSEGNRSPTQESWRGVRRGSSRGHYRSNSIRKVRSAAAIPNVQRQRRRGSRSPPPLSASTEAPESPKLPPMPFDDITSPAMPGMNRFGAHRQQPSTNTAHTSNTGGQSVGSQSTSVVDAIAQTMVGEWMFKYVRRRKSFGVPEKDVEGENGANGVRHKRWVWLAPYERAVMWSSKQPTSGSALMGKSGRKLTIQSVLDVKDDNPAPKGVSPLFDRSILILTPARALKFTATTRERHYMWLTALSFLAHSSQAVPDVMTVSQLPPQPMPDFEIPRQTARLQKNSIRDSIRVAKGKNSTYTPITSRSGPVSGASSQYATDTSTRGGGTGDFSQSGRDLNNYFGPPDAADPPVVPRFSDRPYPGSHGRKRSNTGSRIPPPLSFRGFSDRGPLPPASSSFSSSGPPNRPPLSNGNGMPNGYGGHNHVPSTAGFSIGTNDSSDLYQSQHSSSVAGYGASGRSSIRTSDASGRPSAVIGNFFDAVGTVRMEAFISPVGVNRFDDYPDEAEESRMVGASKRRSREIGSIGILDRGVREGRRRSKNRDSYFGGKGTGPRDDWFSGHRTAGEEDYGYGRERQEDPFRGF